MKIGKGTLAAFLLLMALGLPVMFKLAFSSLYRTPWWIRAPIVCILASVFGGWVAYYVVRALRFGIADARGVRVARRKQPVMFWFTVAVQIVITFECGYLLYLQFHS